MINSTLFTEKGAGVILSEMELYKFKIVLCIWLGGFLGSKFNLHNLTDYKKKCELTNKLTKETINFVKVSFYTYT